MSEDPFASYDAAYVIGALSAQDRQDYEWHLRECDDCARSVRELAGMPGLLAKVPEGLVTATEDPGPPPSLLTSLLRRVRRERRRTRWTAIGAAGLAAAACLALVLALTLRPSTTNQQPVAVPTATMTPQGGAPVSATVGLQDVAWGTRIDMHCRYQSNFGGGSHVYTLVVVDKRGDAEQVGSWSLVPGKDAKVQGGTSWPVSQIASVQVRTAAGQTVLRMSP